MRWVHRFAIGGAVLAALPVPFAPAGVAALETRMIGTIGDVYGASAGGMKMGLMKTGIVLASQALKYGVRRAEESIPSKARPLVRAAVAAATIEAIGFAFIYFHEQQKAAG